MEYYVEQMLIYPLPKIKNLKKNFNLEEIT